MRSGAERNPTGAGNGNLHAGTNVMHAYIHTYIRTQFWKLNELDKGISMCGQIYAFDGHELAAERITASLN